jgi:hypothetical protein
MALSEIICKYIFQAKSVLTKIIASSIRQAQNLASIKIYGTAPFYLILSHAPYRAFKAPQFCVFRHAMPAKRANCPAICQTCLRFAII